MSPRRRTASSPSPSASALPPPPWRCPARNSSSSPTPPSTAPSKAAATRSAPTPARCWWLSVRWLLGLHAAVVPHSSVTPASEPGSIGQPLVRRKNGYRLALRLAGRRIGGKTERAPLQKHKGRSDLRRSALRNFAIRPKLFNLRFLEGDVLARHRIVLLELELLGRGARILLGHVVVAGVRRTHQLDQDRVGLRHFSISSVP